MDHDELEGVAELAYADARLETPHITRLARALLGPDAIQRGPRPLHAPAALVRVGGAWRIIVGRSVPALDAAFAVGHELGHYLLHRHGVHLDEATEEQAADFLGGALLAPRLAFLQARRELGEDHAALGERFGTTHTCAALRLGEVLRRPLAVVAPGRIRVRGPEEWVWPDERTLRAWARRPMSGVRKTRLRDDPRRVVLEPDDLAGDPPMA